MSEENDNNNIDPNTVRELERARSDLKALRAEHKTVQADADRIRGERDALQAKFEAYQAESTEKLTEATTALERSRAEHEAAMAEARTAGDRAILTAQAEAIATRLGAHDPADVVRLIDLSSMSRGEDGVFAGLDEAMTAAKEAKGYLFGTVAPTGAESGTTTTKAPRVGRPPKVDARTAEPKDYEAAKAALLRGG